METEVIDLKPTEKQVQLIRKEEKNHVPIEIRQTAIHRLGSIYVNGATYKGVSNEIEKALLPLVIDIPAEDKNFRTASREFWRSITVKVPSEGTVLDTRIGEDGVPLNPKEYLTYLWAEGHPEVAKTKNEMDKFGKKKFYIHDPERETTQENDKVKSRAKAYKEFVKILDDKKAVNRVLRVIGTQNPDKMSEKQRENALHKQLEVDPKKFYEVATDNSLAVKDFIAELLEKEILRKSGNSILYMDEMLGDTMDETVVYLQNAKNSGTLTDLKSKLKAKREITPNN